MYKELEKILGQVEWSEFRETLAEQIKDVALEILDPIEFLVFSGTMEGLSATKIGQRLYDMRKDKAYDVDREIVIEDMMDAIDKNQNIEDKKLRKYCFKFLELSTRKKEHADQVSMLILMARHGEPWKYSGKLCNMTKQRVNKIQKECIRKITDYVKKNN